MLIEDWAVTSKSEALGMPRVCLMVPDDFTMILMLTDLLTGPSGPERKCATGRIGQDKRPGPLALRGSVGTLLRTLITQRSAGLNLVPAISGNVLPGIIREGIFRFSVARFVATARIPVRASAASVES